MKNSRLDTFVYIAITKELQEKGYSNLEIEGVSLWLCTDKFMEQFGEIVPKGKENEH